MRYPPMTAALLILLAVFARPALAQTEGFDPPESAASVVVTQPILTKHDEFD